MKVYIACHSKTLTDAITIELIDKGIDVIFLKEGDNIPNSSCTLIEYSFLSKLKLPDESDMSNLIIIGYENDFEKINIPNYYKKLLRPFNLDDMTNLIFKDEHSDPLIIPVSVNVLDKIKMDNEKRIISLDSKTLKLSKRQYSLFCYLYTNRGKPCSREDIFNNVWTGNASDLYVVDTYVCYLRNNIESTLGYPKIKNLRNKGYIMQ